MTSRPKIAATPTPNPPLQAQSQSNAGSTLRPFLPPALVTPAAGIRRASGQRRELIGGARATS